MPRVCACCGGTASTTTAVSSTRVQGKRVSRTKTSTWSFPLCGPCLQHDRAWPTASALEVAILTVATCGLYLYFHVKRREHALAMCSTSCALPRQAVAYLGWHGSTHEFEVSSEVFAHAFMMSNAKKVVAADSIARELMQRPGPAQRALPTVAAAAARHLALARPAAWSQHAATPPRGLATPPAPPVRPPSTPASEPSDGFYGPHDSVNVAGRTLHGPLAYVTRAAYAADASTIVASLHVGTALDAEPLPYWPSYTKASPEQRAVYLDWLATGRCDRDVPIGYVFIHFYGLERRALVDACDHELLSAELQRLLAVYGGASRSFRGYASSLIAAMTLPMLTSISEEAVLAQLGPTAQDNPAALAGLLGWFHLHAKPLPASIAMIAVGSMEGARRGTVITRARSELTNLFALRYRERFGDGMRLDASKRPQLVPYHLGSPSLTASRQVRISIPDVLGKPSQFNPLVELWNECVADLKKLSSTRRDDRPDAPLSREAWMALPPELRAENDHPDQEAWDEAVRSAPHLDSFHVMPAGRLAALAGLEAEGRVTGARLRKAVEVAAALGYAVEPDARVSAQAVPVDAEIAIWRSNSTDAPDATLWKSVHTMLSLTLSVALSDGDFAPEEARTVDGLIEDLFVLDDAMRARVSALRGLLTRQPVRVGTVAKKLRESRSASELAKIGRVLVAVAAVDGVIVDGEHKSLKSLYKAMGLPATELASAIVASGARLASDRAVQAQPARAGATGEAIPPLPDAQAHALNAPAIAAILAETREVALLLAEVLDDDDDDDKPAQLKNEPARPVVQATSSENGMWPSLDSRYRGVLRELLTRPVWTAGEVRDLATRRKMMPGAILEALNEWSDEQFGDYLIEEAGDWRINTSLLERPSA